MASFEVYQTARMQAISDSSLVNVEVDADGNLNLLPRNGSPILAGSAVGPEGDQGGLGPAAPAASQTVVGLTRLATLAEAAAEASATVALTPAGVASILNNGRSGYGIAWLGAAVTMTASTAIPFNTFSSWNGEAMSGMTWNAANNCFVVQNAGLYYAECEIAQGSTALAGYVYLQTAPSGTTSWGTTLLGSNTAAIAGTHSYAQGFLQLAAGDQIRAICSAAMNLSAGQGVSHMTLKMLRPL